jgi:hypothetical protein
MEDGTDIEEYAEEGKDGFALAPEEKKLCVLFVRVDAHVVEEQLAAAVR